MCSGTDCSGRRSSSASPQTQSPEETWFELYIFTVVNSLSILGMDERAALGTGASLKIGLNICAVNSVIVFVAADDDDDGPSVKQLTKKEKAAAAFAAEGIHCKRICRRNSFSDDEPITSTAKPKGKSKLSASANAFAALDD